MNDTNPSPDSAARDQEMLELREQARMSELANAVAHEVNNFLNLVVLQTTVLEQLLPDAHGADLQALRRQGGEMAKVVKLLENARRPRPGMHDPRDLNSLVAEEAQVTLRKLNSLEAAHSRAVLRLELAPDLPGVTGSILTFKHLIGFLIANAARVCPSGGELLVRTERTAAGQVRLTVVDAGPNVAPEQLLQLFEFHPIRKGADALELATCRMLARRLRGSICAENQPGNGLAILVELPAAGD